MDIFSHIAISGLLQFGLMQDHNMAEYNLQDNLIYFNQNTTIVNYQTKISLGNYFYIGGGFVAYSLPSEDLNFYIFRQDYTLNIGTQYKNFRLQLLHGCDHPLSPNNKDIPKPKLDCSSDVFSLSYNRLDIVNSNFFIEPLSEIGLTLNNQLVYYDTVDGRTSIPEFKDQSFYIRGSLKSIFYKHLFIQYGLALYMNEDRNNIYQDFSIGVLKDRFEFVYAYKCFQLSAPNVRIDSFKNLNNASNMVYLTIKFGDYKK
jgi:hypothetical protein